MEEDGKKLMALEGVITRFAAGQFLANGIPPEFALLTMKGVYSNFLSTVMEKMIESQITYNGGESQEDRLGPMEGGVVE